MAFHSINDFLSEEELSQEIGKITGYRKEKNFSLSPKLMSSLEKISKSISVEGFNSPIDL